ncbi:hypothetical protein NC652_028767 [Populus alba x Populus x berolinensis]|nr:hypothetical protein NC652_028767 [Populus alba x Populus x berolinensis]
MAWSAVVSVQAPVQQPWLALHPCLGPWSAATLGRVLIAAASSAYHSFLKVMWPEFVASKILRNMLGSNNLVVDLPNSTETMLKLEETSSSSVPPSLISSKKYTTDDQDKHKYKLSLQNNKSRFIYHGSLLARGMLEALHHR